MHKVDKRYRLNTSVIAMALALLPAAASAAGLGKLTVLSALGQPLRAELDINASREELSSMAARLASPDTFKQAGIEYVPALGNIRLSVDKRASGAPYLRISSERPMNEPFLDLLVEITWAQGRLVREYTFLLDPPEELAKPVPSGVAVPEAKRAPAAPAAAPAPAEIPAPPAPAAAEQPVAEQAPKAAESKPAAPKPAERMVKRGDTLTKIALETRPEGVSLDQMLVALFQNNKGAFEANNMHRLKAGKILGIPDAQTAQAIDPAAAHKTIVAQAADFNAYRQKLAAAAAAAAPKEEAPQQAVAGKITPKVEEKAAPAPGKDKLQVSQTAKAGPGGRPGAAEEDQVAREKALKDANARIAELEKNLADMKKLAELKSQSMAELQKQAEAAKQAAKPAPAPAPAPVAAAPEAKQPEVPAAAKPAEPAKVEAPAAPAAEAPKTPEAPKPAAPAPAPKKPVVAPPPMPEPSFVEENPEIVFGGGALLVALAGYLGFSAFRRKRSAGLTEPVSRLTEGDLTANSVFGTTGGQRVDTSSSSIQTDFSQSGMATIDTDEGVDPVAEADVYMAYGRDAQAEEILVDALKSDPHRLAIHLKLLEIYAARKSAKQFETLASEVYAKTGGVGTEWEKAASMGRAMDPENPLYAGKAAAAAEAPAAAAAAVPPLHDRDTLTMPGQLAQMAGALEAAPQVQAPAVEAPAALDFDLDLDLGTPAPAAPAVAAPAPVHGGAAAEPAALDFDLGLESEATTVVTPRPAPAMPTLDLTGPITEQPLGEVAEPLDFNLEMAAPAVPAAPQAKPLELEPAARAPMDFSFELGEAPAAAPKVDLSRIDLELHPAAPAPAPAAVAAAPAVETPAAAGALPSAEEVANQEVATKLELAQAYEEMGDKEGARELLQEVLAEGTADQQETARGKLALLA